LVQIFEFFSKTGTREKLESEPEPEPEPELELASGLKLDFESKLAPVYQVSRSGEKKKVVQKNLIKILLKK
jgi:hypothetical protein